MIFSRLKLSNKIEELGSRFELDLEESYKKRITFQQLMSSVLSLSPTKKNSMWRQGTKIYFTAGNHAKVLESILLQIYCSISPQFNFVSVVLKKWVNDINEMNLKHCKEGKRGQCTLYKWNTIVMVFIFYMQTSNLLPILEESDLQKTYEILI